MGIGERQGEGTCTGSVGHAKGSYTQLFDIEFRHENLTASRGFHMERHVARSFAAHSGKGRASRCEVGVSEVCKPVFASIKLAHDSLEKKKRAALLPPPSQVTFRGRCDQQRFMDKRCSRVAILLS